MTNELLNELITAAREEIRQAIIRLYKEVDPDTRSHFAIYLLSEAAEFHHKCDSPNAWLPTSNALIELAVAFEEIENTKVRPASDRPDLRVVD